MVVLREGRRRVVLAGEQPRGKGPIGEKREPPVPAQRQLSLLHVAIDHVVGTLVRGEGCDLERPRELAMRRVAQADRPRLSFMLQCDELLELPLPVAQRLV